jgi:putative ABC transport system ATP-binding protein
VTYLLSVHELTRVYGTVGTQGAVTAVDHVSFRLPSGGLHAITGPSGSGKSTMLHLVSTLDRPTSGSVELDGQKITQLSRGELVRLRRRLGFVFQRFNLIPSQTARQNILLPFQLTGERVNTSWFSELVDRLGVADRLDHFPHQLSGGQQQRVAIARALVGKPAIVFADEPTGSLDSANAEQVTSTLRELANTSTSTLVVVTHDPALAAASDSEIRIVDGRVHTHQAVSAPA